MATGNNRDVRLGVEVTTAGEDDLRRLAGAVRALGREGDPAAAEYARLASELDRLADQGGAIGSLRTLRESVERLTAAETEASAAAARTAAAYAAQSAATTQAREAQTQAAAASAAAKDSLAALTAERDRAIVAARAEGQAGTALVAATRQQREAVIGAVETLKQRSAELRAADAALKAAEASERRLAAATERSAGAAASTLATLQQQSGALRAAETAAEELGVGIAELAAAEAAYRVALESTDAALAQQLAVRSSIAEIDEQAAAAAQALADRVRSVADAYEQEQAAARATAAETARATAEREKAEAASRALADAEARRAAASREQAEADRLAILQANGLAEARARGRAAAESELATIRESEQFMRRLADAEAEAARVIEAEGVAAMQALERASREADAQVEALARSLRETETAARQFTSATEAAAAAGAEDTAAIQARVRAAEALIESERGLSVAQRELANERDRNRAALVAEAQALLQTTRAAAEAQARIGVLAREAREAGAALERAFGAVGIRSIDAIEREIEQTSAALVKLTSAARAGALSQDELARAAGAAEVKIARLRAEISQVQALPSTIERLNTSVLGLVNKFGALSAAIATIGVAVRPVLEATVALEQMRRVLTTVTGSAEQAQQQIEFLRRVSQQSGQAFDEIGASYAKFAASALQSGLTIQQTQDVFKSVALAAGNLGLSSDQAKRALEALSQIASKGTVSMEELRQQLGDALPGVLPLLAKELGLTQAELVKVVESGQLLASEAIPAIGRSLQSLQGQGARVEGLTANFNRFVNVVKQAGVEIVEGPLGQAAGLVLTALAGVIRDVSVVLVGFNEALKLTGVTALSVFDLLKGDITFQQFGQQISDFAVESGERLQKFKDTAYGAKDGTTALGDGLSKLGTSFARLALDQQRAIDQATLGAQVAEKRAQALKTEADAVKQVVGLSGDEAAGREQAAEATRRATEASEAQLAADQRVVESLKASKAAIEAKAKAEGVGADQIKATIEKLDEKIAKAAADVEKTEAQTRALRLQTAELELAAAATGDQSKRIDELRQAVGGAVLELERVIDAQKRDAATSEDVEKAATALAKAKGLLRNAIDDLSEALDKQLALLRADAKFTESSIKLDVARAKAAQEAALALGNEYEARQQGIRIKELELTLDRSKQTLKTQEAEATLRALDLQEQELRKSGQLTAEKRNEIEVKRTLARASVLEAQADEEGNAAKQKQIELSKRGGTALQDYNDKIAAGTKATEGNTSATTSNTGARNTNTDSIRGQTAATGDLITAERALAAVREQERRNSRADPGNLSSGLDERNRNVRSTLGRNVDAEGFVVDAQGNRIGAAGSESADGFRFDAKRFQRDFQFFQRLVANGGRASAPDPKDYLVPVATDADLVSQRPNPVTAAAPTQASTPTPTGTVRVQITVNGSSSTVNVASAQDAYELQSLLKSLETAASRTSP